MSSARTWYAWSVSGVRVVRSGTVSTLRAHGTMPPYNIIEIDANEVRIAMRQAVQGEVRYDADSFAATSRRAGGARARAKAPSTDKTNR
jgi:hypothetical protein